MKEPWGYWYDHCADEDDYRNHCPVCVHCGEPIEDDIYIDIEDNFYHIDCMKELYEKDTSEYVRRAKENEI